MSACKKSCCWTPFQVCATKKECSCHMSEKSIYERLTALEVERAQSVMKSRWKK